ncbi:hypothetical protein [Paenochrobactrum pullorum]|uniref:hypothetical protein n=1 Tax=Paenochrobactrum pullorum TaxID=1324351 RepID=UPI0035BBA230
MQIVQARGREIPVITKKRTVPVNTARRAAEELFKRKPSAMERQAAIRKGLAIKIVLDPKDETEHEKVFRLVREQKFEEAARIAARLINAGKETGFYIFEGTHEFTKSVNWHQDWVADKEVRANVHYITPARAQVLLMNNPNNRNVKAANLASIMRDIVGGRFKLNGETLIIADDGTVNDGQHRCFSVLLTNTQIESLVASGVTKQSMRTVNIGMKREAKDRLAIAGVSNYVVLSAMAALVFELTFGRKPTPSESEDYYFDHAEAFQAALSCCGAGFKGIGQAAMGAAAFYLLRTGYAGEHIKAFFAAVRTGEMLTKRDARMVLRRAIFDADKKVKLSRDKWVSAFVAHFEKHQQRKSLSDITFDITLDWS